MAKRECRSSVLGLRIRDKRDRLIVTPFVRREAGVPLDHHSRGGERDHPSTCKIRAPLASRFGSEIFLWKSITLSPRDIDRYIPRRVSLFRNVRKSGSEFATNSTASSRRLTLIRENRVHRRG